MTIFEDDDDGDDEGERTPLDYDEADDLIPDSVGNRGELNQWEALNIANAHDWAFARTVDPLSVTALTDLHRRMFDQTWKWAGMYRRSEKNISPYHWSQVPTLLQELVLDTGAQWDASIKTPEALDEIALRFHHRLVRIHPWPNGNGRHSRLATDLLLRYWGRPQFTWGSGADLVSRGTARARYLSALREADAGNYRPLLEFVRS